MVKAYSNLPGFLTTDSAPEYFKKLQNIGELTANPAIKIFTAVSKENVIAGAVVYFSDMQFYGSAGSAPKVKNAAGFRFLATSDVFRGHGLGKMLTNYCIEYAKSEQQEQLVIHTTNAMKIAWGMYERIGFERSVDLDFRKGALEVFGFRYRF
ncbi:MAG: GNAT family N-acetyltransferase [bacterium]|nr:GNAT family N-acetyltransferase [bacterium]